MKAGKATLARQVAAVGSLDKLLREKARAGGDVVGRLAGNAQNAARQHSRPSHNKQILQLRPLTAPAATFHHTAIEGGNALADAAFGATRI